MSLLEMVVVSAVDDCSCKHVIRNAALILKSISTRLEPFNVAFLCRTSQSSTKTEGSVSFSSSLGVDGKTNDYLGSPDQACASTQSGATSWWQVDLGGPRNVDVVSLGI